MSIKQHAFTAACMAALLGGCAATAAPEAENHSQPGLQRVWMLTDINGVERAQLVALQAQMDLTALPQAAANMGCNRLNFTAQSQDKGQIRFGEVMSTRMYCAGRMDAEQQFGQRIGQMKHYRLEGQRLILRNDAGEEMHFVAQDWD